MKRITSISLFVLLALVSVGFTVTASAQPSFSPTTGAAYYASDFNMSPELAQYLGLSTTQVSSIKRQHAILNYDVNDKASSIADIDDQIQSAQQQSSQSPANIGTTVGNLIQQRVTLVRAETAVIAVANKALLAVLTSAQQSLLTSLQNAVQNANNVLNLSSAAYGANLVLASPAGSVSTDLVASGLVPTGDDQIEAAVASVKAERIRQRTEAQRNKRSAQHEQR